MHCGVNEVREGNGGDGDHLDALVNSDHDRLH